MRSVLARIQQLISGWPIVGGLAYCTWKNHKSTISEMAIILTFATATFWSSSIFFLGFAQSRAKGFGGLLYSSISSGELFIFVVGFIGPILVLTTTDDKPTSSAFPGFPGRRWHTVTIILLGIAATIFHVQIKYSILIGQSKPQDMEYAVGISIWIAGAAVVLRYLAMVYKKAYFEPGQEIKNKEENFAEQYAEHVREDHQ